MKTIILAADFTLDEAQSTPLAFNLKYNGGLFFSLFDHSPASRGVEPYPEGTSVMINTLPGTVIATPIATLTRVSPQSDSHIIHRHNINTILNWMKQHLDAYLATAEVICEWNIEPG
jgi:hypothetical protein